MVVALLVVTVSAGVGVVTGLPQLRDRVAASASQTPAVEPAPTGSLPAAVEHLFRLEVTSDKPTIALVKWFGSGRGDARGEASNTAVPWSVEYEPSPIDYVHVEAYPIAGGKVGCRVLLNGETLDEKPLTGQKVECAGTVGVNR